MESRIRLYKDKVNGKFLGVCAGLADYFGLDVAVVRIAVLGTAIFSGGATVPLYFICAWATDPKPVDHYSDDPERSKFWSETRVAPHRSIRDVNSRFRDLDRRLRDIEAHAVTSNNRLAAEIDSLR